MGAIGVATAAAVVVGGTVEVVTEVVVATTGAWKVRKIFSLSEEPYMLVLPQDIAHKVAPYAYVPRAVVGTWSFVDAISVPLLQLPAAVQAIDDVDP